MGNKPTALDLLKKLKALNAQIPATPKPAEAPPSLEQTITQDPTAQARTELSRAQQELHSLRQEYQAYKTEKQQTITDQTLKIGQLETQLESLTEQSLEAVQAKEDLKIQLETARKELAELEESYKDLEETSAIGEKHLREDLAEEENKIGKLETQVKATAEGQERLLRNLSDLRQYNADLEDDSDNMREFGQDRQIMFAVLVNEVKDTRTRLTTDQNTIRDQDNQIKTLTATAQSLDEVVKQNLALTQQINQKDGELLDKESQLTTLQREYGVYKFTQEEKAKELEQQITTKQTELTLAQERAASLEQDVAAYTIQIRESQGTNQETATELERTSGELTQVREDVKTLQNALFETRSQKDALEKLGLDKEKEFEERKNFLQNQYSGLEQDRDGLKAQLDQRTQEIEQYETQLSGKRDKIKVLREAITEQRNIIQKLREVERINQELAEARQTDAQQYEAKIDALEKTNKYLGGRLAKAITRIFRQKNAIKEQQVKHARIRELEERLEILTSDKTLVDRQLTDLGQEKDHLQKQNKHMGREYEKTIDGLSDQLLIERRKYRENKSSFREYVLAATISIALLAFGYQMIEYAKILTQGPAKAVDVHELIKKK